MLTKEIFFPFYRVFLFLMYDFHTVKCTLLTLQLSEFLLYLVFTCVCITQIKI